MPSFPLGMSQNLYRFIDAVIISLLSRHPLACQRAQPFPYTPCQNTSHSTHSANVSRVAGLRKLLISTPANLCFSWPISASFESTIFQSRVCSRSFSRVLDGSVASIFTLHLPSSLAATISLLAPTTDDYCGMTLIYLFDLTRRCATIRKLSEQSNSTLVNIHYLQTQATMARCRSSMERSWAIL